MTSALAQVLELPGARASGFRPSALEMLQRGESMWARWPGGDPPTGSIFLHPDDAAQVVAQGWMIIDGIRAKTSFEIPVGYHSPIIGWVPPCPYTVHLEFDEPFRAHP